MQEKMENYRIAFTFLRVFLPFENALFAQTAAGIPKSPVHAALLSTPTNAHMPMLAIVFSPKINAAKNIAAPTKATRARCNLHAFVAPF